MVTNWVFSPVRLTLYLSIVQVYSVPHWTRQTPDTTVRGGTAGGYVDTAHFTRVGMFGSDNTNFNLTYSMPIYGSAALFVITINQLHQTGMVSILSSSEVNLLICYTAVVCTMSLLQQCFVNPTTTVLKREVITH